MSDVTEPLQRTELPSSSRRSTPLLLGALGIVALVALAFLGITVLGDDSTQLAAEEEAAPTAAEVSDDPAADTVDDDGDLAALPTVTYDVYLARDPFDPVVPEPEPEPEPADPTSPDPTTGDPTVPGTDPTEPTPGTPLPGEEPTAPGASPPGTPAPTEPAPGNGYDCRGGQGEMVCDGRVVTLQDVTMRDGLPLATIQVDTTVYEVRRGEVFAGQFLLRAIDGDCVDLLYGDDGFRLCRGDQVLK